MEQQSPNLEVEGKRAHPTFDLPAARDIFVKRSSLRGELVSSPFHLFCVETLRDKHGLRASEKALPVDVFVWGIGEGKRHLTKVSGLAENKTMAAEQIWKEPSLPRSIQFLRLPGHRPKTPRQSAPPFRSQRQRRMAFRTAHDLLRMAHNRTRRVS